ncbi:PLP-dependent aminotransferase family protein [Desulfospira joergensenii]|uniref:aminotransferase-like domain-containing protein n=1 Tax=Desulfospira joergensenii TaxID=53329 RepID=UPI0003B6ED6D|nr:PLP-dependent aminotransferase family protein [Desulfospira joergensenii]
MAENGRFSNPVISKRVIHLGIGQPDPDLLPLTELEEAASLGLKTDDRSFLNYGSGKGNEDFLELLARFLTHQYPDPVQPDQLFVTNGNSQALDLICTLFTRPGDTVLVEEPSFFLAFKIFGDHGLNLVSIPVDENGLVIHEVREKLKTSNPAFLYTIPTYHNPAGVTLSNQRRRELARICSEHQVLIVADEVYHFLNYTGEEILPMGSLCGDCPLISLGSFSKVLAPGLRLGWIHARADLVEKLDRSGLVLSGGGLNPFTSRIVNAFMEKGFLAANIEKLKQIYSQRRDFLCGQLEQYLKGRIRFYVPGGGYFVWVRLPDHVDASALRKIGLECRVDYFAGKLFSSRNGLHNYIRLCFAYYPEKDLAKGVRRLADAFARFDESLN